MQSLVPDVNSAQICTESVRLSHISPKRQPLRGRPQRPQPVLSPGGQPASCHLKLPSPRRAAP